MNFGTLKDIFAENLVNSYISENKDKVPPSSSINMWSIVNGY